MALAAQLDSLFHPQFPDYPLSDLPEIPAGWVERSWRNDACPQFVTNPEGPGFSVWTDYAAPENRDFPEMSRFTVYSCDAEGAFTNDSPVLQSDDWSAVLAFVAAEGRREPLEGLTACFAAWMTREGLTFEGDALEMLMFADLTPERRAWLSAFVTLWDLTA